MQGNSQDCFQHTRQDCSRDCLPDCLQDRLRDRCKTACETISDSLSGGSQDCLKDCLRDCMQEYLQNCLRDCLSYKLYNQRSRRPVAQSERVPHPLSLRDDDDFTAIRWLLVVLNARLITDGVQLAEPQVQERQKFVINRNKNNNKELSRKVI